MNAVLAPAADVAPLATALFDRALRAFRVLPPVERDAILPVLDAFLAAPGPARFLAAARTIAAARRARSVAALRDRNAAYSFARGIDAVGDELGPDDAALFTAIPVDDRAGRRLRALALLSAACRELGERVAGQAEAMRRALAAPPAEPAQKVRRITHKRARAAKRVRPRR